MRARPGRLKKVGNDGEPVKPGEEIEVEVHSFVDECMSQESLSENEMVSQEIIVTRPKDYVKKHLRPKKEVVYEPPPVPDLLKEGYNPAAFLAQLGGSRQELEKLREKTRVVHEKAVRLAKAKFEKELAEAEDDAQHEYFNDMKVPRDAGIVRKQLNVRRRHSARGRKHAQLFGGKKYPSTLFGKQEKFNAHEIPFVSEDINMMGARFEMAEEKGADLVSRPTLPGGKIGRNPPTQSALGFNEPFSLEITTGPGLGQPRQAAGNPTDGKKREMDEEEYTEWGS